MFRPCVPPARSARVGTRIARALWTLPTNWVGHALGLLATHSLPKTIGGPAARASVYVLPSSRITRMLGAIAFGNVILAEAEFIAAPRGSWILAHELSHTRQHAWLGPFYLPIHFAFQVLSGLVAAVRPLPNFPPQHAYNPLERIMLYVPFDVLLHPGAIDDDARDRIWGAFGVESAATEAMLRRV